MRFISIVLVLPLFLACGGTEPTHDHGGHEYAAVLHFAASAIADEGLFEISWERPDGEPVRGANTIHFVVTDRDGHPVEGANVAVDLFMPTHGHGSSATPVVTELGEGLYEATNVVFQMAGEWHLTVRVQSGAGDDQATFTVDVG